MSESRSEGELEVLGAVARLVVEGEGSWPAIQLLELIENKELPEGFQLKQSQSFEAFGTAQLHLQTPAGRLLCDLSSARSERYAFPGAHPEVEPADLLEDLKRRDFSINAIADQLPSGQSPLLDPFDGRRDLDAGIIRTPLDPEVTFSDDPLRMMRAIRFSSQLGFEIEAKTLQAIARTLSQSGLPLYPLPYLPTHSAWLY